MQAERNAFTRGAGDALHHQMAAAVISTMSSVGANGRSTSCTQLVKLAGPVRNILERNSIIL